MLFTLMALTLIPLALAAISGLLICGRRFDGVAHRRIPPSPAALARPSLPAGQRVIIVLPTYNEVDNIRSTLEALMACEEAVEVLVVDDNSPDGTAAEVLAVSADHAGRVHLLQRPGKSGLGSAYRAGFAWALGRQYPVIVQMDADGSHPADRLPAMLEILRGGDADLVVGSRYVDGGGTQGWPVSRRVLSRAANTYARTLLDIDQKDVTGAFRAWRADALLQTGFSEGVATGFGFLVELVVAAHRQGLRLREVPITFVDRTHGRSKMTVGIALEGLALVWHLRASRLTTHHPSVPALSPAP